ncbi:MAG: helix-turn-helix domain-containing protein [Chloroflexi bacterium]|nr:helix-turn-helix domain-containing protein [Chloroflexota bacterium]
MAPAPLEAELEVIAALREPTRRRLYQYVERQPRGVSRDEAAAAVGVSRALAAFHLDKLIGVGLLKADYRRLTARTGPGAGRTSKIYRRSRRQFEMSLPHRNHELLARLLAEASPTDAQPSSTEAPAYKYGRLLGRRARRRIRAGADDDRLLGCVRDVLETLGFEPYEASAGHLRLRNCPFAPLSRQFTPVVCAAGQALAMGILQGVGADQLAVTRDERPDQCCVVVQPDGSPAPQGM